MKSFVLTALIISKNDKKKCMSNAPAAIYIIEL
jgi:hypothetical protein